MNTLTKLEIDIVKIVTQGDGKYLSEIDIYKKLLEDSDLKNSVEKYELKEKFQYILRRIPSMFKHIDLINKKDVISLRFNLGDEYDEYDEYDECDKSHEYDEKFDKPLNEYSVIKFIIDEKCEKYFSYKDDKGNTILHNIVLYNDLERFKQIYQRHDISLFDENDNGDTPIDLISDFKISNFLIRKLLVDFNEQKFKLFWIKSNYDILDKEYYSLCNFCLLLLVIICVFLFFGIYFCKF
jgi:hypothetical protein